MQNIQYIKYTSQIMTHDHKKKKKLVLSTAIINTLTSNFNIQKKLLYNKRLDNMSEHFHIHLLL